MKTFWALLLLTFHFVAVVTAETTVMASGMEVPEGAFWLTTEITSLSFSPGCLSTQFCKIPQFTITQSLEGALESSTMRWPISENFTSDARDHPFVTYWTSGEPKYIYFSAEVNGIDPTYAFPRICDQAPKTKIFQPDNAYLRQALRPRRHLGDDHRKAAQVADTPMEFNLIGKCFNATLAIRRHTERCPWCPDIDLHVSLSSNEATEATQWNENLMADDRVFYCIIILCASCAVTLVGVVACLCVFAPCCSRKRIRRSKSDKTINKNLYHQRALPPNHFLPMQQTMELLKSRQQMDDDEHHYQMPMLPPEGPENRYETPWDRKYRPIQQYWNPSSLNSQITVTSPIDSSSAIGSLSTDRTTIGGGNSRASLPGGSHYATGSMTSGTAHGMINADGTVRIPPNFNSNNSPMSSNGNTSRHDDSGLESV